MNVAQLLDKLFVVTNVEIVIALLPEVLMITDQAPRCTLLQGLERISETASFGLTHQKMNVLWHHDVAIDTKSVASAYAFERVFKSLLRCERVE